LRSLARYTARIANAGLVSPLLWIVADVQAFAGGAEQHDDITAIVVKVREL
jgi:hypothetical protein